jgi:hypothetical protein
MNSPSNVEYLLNDSETQPNSLVDQSPSEEYVEHPYRFVSFVVFVILNILGGTFMSAFTPLKKVIGLVSW